MATEEAIFKDLTFLVIGIVNLFLILSCIFLGTPELSFPNIRVSFLSKINFV